MQTQSNITETYFLMLQHLSIVQKKALAEKLLSDIAENNPQNQKKIHDFYGVWQDEQNAEDMINTLRASRNFTRNTDFF